MGAELSQFVNGWVDYLSVAGLPEVRKDAESPWASVALGAAGNAYALWHIAKRSRKPAMLTQSQRWWRAAVRAAETRSGFDGPNTTRRAGGSVSFGRAGLHLVEALVAHDRGRARDRDRALGRFAGALRRAKRTYAEFNHGLAGAVSGALLAYRHTQVPAMCQLADELAARLLAEPELAMQPFAHGAIGVQHALLAWAQHTGGELPGRVLARLACPEEDAVVNRAPGFGGSWCNGLTGYVFLWVKAFEVTGDAAWRARAVRAARRLTSERFTTDGSLCCGQGGQAYAMLAVSRIDASEDWRAHAVELCTRSLGIRHHHGLVRGLSGLACLATDLTTPGEARYPLVEP
jgi:lantibiotic modifying enzyme